MKREVWIDGPKLPAILIEKDDYGNRKHFCATAVNSTTVYFFIKGKSGIENMLTYDFQQISGLF